MYIGYWTLNKYYYLLLSSLTSLERECYEGEVQPYRKTDYKPIIFQTAVTVPPRVGCVVWSLHLLFSSTYNPWLDSMLWKNHHSVLSCIIELLDENSMIYCMVSCRQISKRGSCDHAPLVERFTAGWFRA